jgi:hypothetical protein
LSIIDPVAIAVGIAGIGAVHIRFVVVEQTVAVTVGPLLEGVGGNALEEYQARGGDGRWVSPHQGCSREQCSRRSGSCEAPHDYA